MTNLTAKKPAETSKNLQKLIITSRNLEKKLAEPNTNLQKFEKRAENLQIVHFPSLISKP